MAEAAAMGLQAAGSIVQGIGAYKAGKYNRDVANVMATEDERDGAAQEGRIREAARASLGAQVASQGENGFQVGTGSAIDALAESQINAVVDAMTVRRQAASAARANRIKGQIAFKEGEQALIAGLFSAGSKVLSGQSDWATARAGTSAGRAGGSGGAPSGGGIVFGGGGTSSLRDPWDYGGRRDPRVMY